MIKNVVKFSVAMAFAEQARKKEKESKNLSYNDRKKFKDSYNQYTFLAVTKGL